MPTATTKAQLASAIEEMVCVAESDARSKYYQIIDMCNNCPEVSDQFKQKLAGMFMLNIADEMGHEADAKELLEDLTTITATPEGEENPYLEKNV